MAAANLEVLKQNKCAKVLVPKFLQFSMKKLELSFTYT